MNHVAHHRHRDALVLPGLEQRRIDRAGAAHGRHGERPADGGGDEAAAEPARQRHVLAHGRLQLEADQIHGRRGRFGVGSLVGIELELDLLPRHQATRRE